MENVIKIAKYTLWFCENKLGRAISNLQLQKFLYYEQGISLALKKSELFASEIKAWKYGPVVPDAYYWFNDNMSNEIKGVENTEDCISEDARKIVEFVSKMLINMDPWDLVEQTHKEDPWKNTYIEGFNETINIIDIKEYFEKNYLKSE